MDHLFLDQDAIPTLVEVKCKGDTRLRREVVGQLFEYAADAIAHWSGGTLKTCFTEMCKRRGQNAEAVLADFWGHEQDAATFWHTAHTNLQNGNIRLVAVAETISPELQHTVEFLNEQMNPVEVLALKIRRYSGGEFATRIPRLIGRSTTAPASNGQDVSNPLKSRRTPIQA